LSALLINKVYILLIKIFDVENFLVLAPLLILPFWEVDAAKYVTVPNPPPPNDLVVKCDSGNYSSNACSIAKDLSSLSPSNIATYGLVNQESTAIEQSLKLGQFHVD
jgi:hypothetical protein